MKQTKQFLRPLLMAIVMLVGMLMPQGAWAEDLDVDYGETKTIDSDASYDMLNVYPGGVLIINKGVTLTVTEGLNINGYDIDNFGTVINYGTIKGEASINMNGGVLANHGHIDLNGADGYGTFYNTGTHGDDYFNLTPTECYHDDSEDLYEVDATCTHGAGTQVKCYTCFYIGIKETGEPLPHDNYDHNGLTVCSTCGQLTFDATPIGEGTAERPYQIANAGHLFWFADKVNNDYDNFKDANAVLTADIVVNDGTFAADGTFTATGASEPSTPIEWLIIGRFNEYPYGYGGTFDGQGHTISGLYANYVYSGLVGCSARECKIKNVGVINSYFAGIAGAGGICGFADCNIEISNCYSSNVICKGGYVGGILGQSYYSGVSITNCYSTASLIGVDDEDQVGGIAGGISGSTTNCYTTYGNVNGSSRTEINCEANVTPERFASGEIAYKLNGSVDGEGNWTAGATDGTQAWYQKIGTDAAPVLVSNGSNTVYEVDLLTCSGENAGKTFANANEAVTQHDYQVLLDENSNPVFVWSEEYTSATLQVVCSHNAEHTANVEVTGEDITSAVTTPATCTTAGVRTYTATATYKDETYTGTKEVEVSIDPDAHAYQVQLDEDEKPVFVWSVDYTTATLQVVCSHNAEHTANVEVTGEGITSAVTTPATCTTAGVRTYTATATYEGDTYTGTKEVEIPATGHSFDEETDPDHTHCTACDHWWTYYTTTGEDIAGIEERVGAVAHYFNEGNGYFETEECFTSVPEGAFFEFDHETNLGLNLKSISLPFVTRVGNEAFNNCQSLESVTLPEATTIGANAFAMCKALTAISLPEAITIGDDAFSTDIALESISLPKAVTIGDYAFEGCPNLTELTLPCNFDLYRENVGLGENESVTISRVHKGESVAIEGVPATCTEDGYEAYEGCSVCLEPFGEKTVILALGHTSVTDEAVPATCTESGLTEGSHCSVCGDLLVLQEVTPALGHTPVTDEGKDATCVEPGLTAGLHCSVCDNVLVAQEEIPALGHDFKDQVIAENQGEDGYYHYGCSRCDELDSDYSFAKMFGEFREVTEDAAPTASIQLTQVGTYYYTSLYTDFPYVVGGDDVAYYVTSAEDGVVTLDNTAYVRAGSGVIFRSTNSECTIEYDPEGFENTAPEDNLLTGSTTAITAPNNNQYAFGLSNEGFLGFWRWPNMTIPAWKAYLELDEETAARGFRIVFDDETNGIQQLPSDASAIEGSYDLMGHKVREVKGLGIVNGKKVFVNY